MAYYEPNSTAYNQAITQYGADALCVNNLLEQEVPGAYGYESDGKTAKPLNLGQVKYVLDWVKTQGSISKSNVDEIGKKAYKAMVASSDYTKPGSYKASESNCIWTARAYLKCLTGTPIANAPYSSNLQSMVVVVPPGNTVAFAQQYAIPLVVGGLAIGIIGWLLFKGNR
jgi:hypothetical protein